jgi:hypothetical protein
MFPSSRLCCFQSNPPESRNVFIRFRNEYAEMCISFQQIDTLENVEWTICLGFSAACRVSSLGYLSRVWLGGCFCNQE